MIAKMRSPQDGGSRIAIIFNGSPLFTGDAGGGESEIRRWIIENDWLEAIVALPEQLFYNTGISTYLWVLTNRKQKQRKTKVQLIDARQFWVQMEKSLGNKRRRIGDPSDKEKDPNHIGELTKIFGNFKDGETRIFTEEDAITHQPVKRERVVSKIFDNDDFGYHKITVERPLRVMGHVTEAKLAELREPEGRFQFIVTEMTAKEGEKLADLFGQSPGRMQELEWETLSQALADLCLPMLKIAIEWGPIANREEFRSRVNNLLVPKAVKWLPKKTLNLLCAHFEETHPEADPVLDDKGRPLADADLRDTETVPLKESIEAYFKREVLPHVPDAWIDTTKTKVGYEIPLNRHFYRYEPPRPLEDIETDIKKLESEILDLLKEVTA